MAHTRWESALSRLSRRFRESLPVRGYYGDVGVGKTVVLAGICDLHICVTSIEERNSLVSVRDPSPVRSAMARSGAWVFSGGFGSARCPGCPVGAPGRCGAGR